MICRHWRSMNLFLLHSMADELQQVLQGMTNPQASTFPLLCFTLTATVALLELLHCVTSARRRRGSHERRLPPSPPGLPVIGHLHHLMAAGNPPHVALRDLAERHAADGLMLLRLGRVPTLVVSSPRAAEAILHAHDHAFASRPRSALTDIVFGGATDVAFAPYGEYWRKARRLVTAHLLSSGKVQSFRRAREEEARAAIGKIHASAAGAAVDVSDVLRSFELGLISRAVSGRLSRPEGRRNELFRQLIDENADMFGGFNLQDCFPSLAKVPLLRRAACRRAEKLKERWDKLIDELIDHHATKPSGADCNRREEEEDGDFIDVLLSVQQEYGLTRVNIKAILLDMFAAGSDTSYIVLEFAMAELIRKPHLLTKLQDEVRTKMPKGKKMVTEDDLSTMAYMKAVIKETLRLHPPAPLLLPHLSTAICDVLEIYTVLSGTRVIVNTWAIGRDCKSWERANDFVPERFMEGGDIANVDFKGRDFRFLPFGAGRRMCPGMNFGMASMEIMLANLVYCFDWELPPKMKVEDMDMTYVFGVTMHLKEKLLLVARPHNANYT